MIQNMLQISDFQRIGWTPEVLDDQVFLVKGVLTSDERGLLLSEIESYTDDAWKENYVTGMREYALRQFGRTMEELIEDGVLSLDEEWIDKTIQLQPSATIDELDEKIQTLVEPYGHLEFRGIGNAQRQPFGAELKLHTDGDSEPAVVYAVIFYLNDDYTGGELYFPTRSLEVRPPAGSVIFFPTTNEYKHGVHPVGPGPTRYVLPSFIQTVEE
jgi:hypothetical protein